MTIRTQPGTMDRGRGSRQAVRLAAVATVLALLLAACGADDDEADSGAADTDETDTEETDTEDEGDIGDDPPSADAEFTLQFTSIFSPGSEIQDAMEWWMDEVEERTDGRVEFERFYGGALIAGTDTLAGLGENRAQAGYLVPAYTPGDLPLLNIAMLPGAGGQDNEAHARAIAWLAQNNEAVIEEAESRGSKIQVSIIIASLDTVMSPESITDISQFEGMSLRAIGAISQAFEAIGANPVAIEAQEAYESLDRGVIDGVQSLPLASIPAEGIHEVAPWVVSLGLGHFGAGSLALSLDQWESLPPDIQEIIEGVNEDFYAANAQIAMEAEESACDQILDVGGGVTQLPEDQAAAWLDDVGESMLEGWRDDARSSGYTDEQIESVESDLARMAAEFEAETTFVDGLEACMERSPDPNS